MDDLKIGRCDVPLFWPMRNVGRFIANITNDWEFQHINTSGSFAHKLYIVLC